MTEVEQDAQIVQTDLLNTEQGAGRVREDDLVTRLAWLVFDHELDLGVPRRARGPSTASFQMSW